MERVRLGELASRSWLRRRRSLWGVQVGERRRRGPLISLWSRQRLLTLRRKARLSTLTPGPIRERALLDFVEAREVVGSCTSPDQWAILQHRADESFGSSKAAMSVQHLERFSKEADPLSSTKGDALQMGAIE